MNQNIAEKMNAWIDAHTEEMVALLQDFARIPSVSRADLAEENAPFGADCRTMLDYALARSREMGFETIDHEGYAGEAYMGDYHHALGIIGHLDVVPIASGWVYPPYGATRKDDFLIGRGVSDNKNACVMSLFLMKMYRELGIELKHGFRTVFGMSEETGMQDMSYMVAHKEMPVISLVPDAHFPVCKAQKGSLSGYVSIERGAQLDNIYAGEAVNIVPPEASIEIALDVDTVQAVVNTLDASLYAVSACDFGCKLTTFGRATHAASPYLGLNAIHLIADVLCRLPLTDAVSKHAAEAMFKLTEGYFGECVNIQGQDKVSGKTTLNIGMARTEGDRFNLHLDSRVSIASDPDEMQENLRVAAEAMGFKAEKLSNTKPFHLPDDHPAMNALMNAYREITSYDDPAYAIGGGTYSRVVSTAVTFGPGLKDVIAPPAELPEGHGGAHQNDELLHIPTWIKAVKIYASAIVKLDEVTE